MPRHPTKPKIPVGQQAEDEDDASLSSERHYHRSCAPARQAIAAVTKLSHQMEVHAADDNSQLSTLRGDVEEIRGDVGSINTHVGNLRVDMARVVTAVDGITATLDAQKEITHVKMIAEVETGKAEKIAVIEDDVDRKKAKRALWLKIAVLLVGGLGYVLGLLVETIVKHIR